MMFNLVMGSILGPQKHSWQGFGVKGLDVPDGAVVVPKGCPAPDAAVVPGGCSVVVGLDGVSNGGSGVVSVGILSPGCRIHIYRVQID